MNSQEILEHLEAKYPGLDITYYERKDGRIDWVFNSHKRGKGVAIIYAKGITPTIPPVVILDEHIGDFYKLHQAAL